MSLVLELPWVFKQFGEGAGYGSLAVWSLTGSAVRGSALQLMIHGVVENLLMA